MKYFYFKSCLLHSYSELFSGTKFLNLGRKCILLPLIHFLSLILSHGLPEYLQIFWNIPSMCPQHLNNRFLPVLRFFLRIKLRKKYVVLTSLLRSSSSSHSFISSLSLYAIDCLTTSKSFGIYLLRVLNISTIDSFQYLYSYWSWGIRKIKEYVVLTSPLGSSSSSHSFIFSFIVSRRPPGYLKIFWNLPSMCPQHLNNWFLPVFIFFLFLSITWKKGICGSNFALSYRHFYIH